MSVWLPPALPPTVEDIWLPTACTDSSMSPTEITQLEEALEKRREAVRNKPFPDPIGTRASMSFQPASTVEPPQQAVDDDEMDVEPEELASDEITDDGEFGTPMGDVGGEGDDDMQEEDNDELDDDDDDDDDDDLAAYL